MLERASVQMKSPAAFLLQAIDQNDGRPTTANGHGPSGISDLPYIHPSSLARGCMLYIARELLGIPKAEPEARVRRILEVGTQSHNRIGRYLAPYTMAREVFFCDQEHHIRGYADALLYFPPLSADGQRPPADSPAELQGFYVVEIKTAGSEEFARMKAAGAPKEEHWRQCQVYLWGLERYYGLPLQGGIILVENRDTLEYLAFDVVTDAAAMADLLARVKATLQAVAEGRLPEDHLPREHWAHAYCPYLSLCSPGQEAVAWQREHRPPLPDTVVADIIAKRIVAKRRGGGEAGGRKKRGDRSLQELAAALGWQ